jgi:hypothetical protein
MACGDVLSLEDLQTAKKHQIFEAEVITGKAGGVAGGANIGTATNPVTGQTQQTLPSILADLGFDVQSWTSSTGGVLASANQVFLNDTPGSLGLGDYYAWGGAFEKTVPAGTDPALPTSGYIMRSSRFASTQAREALRRSYAEAGYNLVDGSFEAGSTLVNANDVLLQERTGKAFSGPAGTVSAGTNPASGGFTDKSDVLLSNNGVVYLRAFAASIDDTQRFIDAIATSAGGTIHVCAGTYNVGTVPINRFGCDIELDKAATINVSGNGFYRNLPQVTRDTFVAANTPIYGDVYILPLKVRGGTIIVANNATAVYNRVPFMVRTGGAGSSAPTNYPGIGLTESLSVDSNIHLTGANSIAVGVHGGWGSEILGTITGRDCGIAIDIAPDGTYSPSSHPQEIKVGATMYSCAPMRSARGTCTNSAERVIFLPECSMQFVQRTLIQSVNVVNIDSILLVSLLDSFDIIDCGRASVSGSYFQATGNAANAALNGIVNVSNCANFVWSADNKVIANSNVTNRAGVLLKTNASNDTVSTKIKGGEFLMGGSQYAVTFNNSSTFTFDVLEIGDITASGANLLAAVNFFPLTVPAKRVTIGNIDVPFGAAGVKYIEGLSPSKLDYTSLVAPLYTVSVPLSMRGVSNDSGLSQACMSVTIPVSLKSTNTLSSGIAGYTDGGNSDAITATVANRQSVTANLIQKAGLTAGKSVSASGTIFVNSVRV